MSSLSDAVDKKKAASLIIFGQLIESAVHLYSPAVGGPIIDSLAATYINDPNVYNKAEREIIQDTADTAKRRLIRGDVEPKNSLTKIVQGLS